MPLTRPEDSRAWQRRVEARKKQPRREIHTAHGAGGNHAADWSLSERIHETNTRGGHTIKSFIRMSNELSNQVQVRSPRGDAALCRSQTHQISDNNTQSQRREWSNTTGGTNKCWLSSCTRRAGTSTLGKERLESNWRLNALIWVGKFQLQQSHLLILIPECCDRFYSHFPEIIHLFCSLSQRYDKKKKKHIFSATVQKGMSHPVITEEQVNGKCSFCYNRHNNQGIMCCVCVWPSDAATTRATVTDKSDTLAVLIS